MTEGCNRRDVLLALTVGSGALAIDPVGAIAFPPADKVNPFSGSWFEFQHHATVEGVDWNPACARFSAEQWDAKIREAAEIGMDTLVLMATAVYYRAFFDTPIFAKWQLACSDPLEAVLSAADKYHVRFFIGAGFYGDWQSDKTITDPVASKKRLQAIEEIANRYAHHPSFYGWYWPDEAEIHPYYTQEFIEYVNTCSGVARQVMPHAPILIAPYGTRTAIADDRYIRQLDALDVDIFAYQDEVGVRKSTATETPAFFETLRKAHDRSQKAKLWADVEIFDFQGEVYNSALMPASFERILRQLQSVSPWVDKVLAYQYQGMMNKPNSVAFAGCPASARLYADYASWLKGRYTSGL